MLKTLMGFITLDYYLQSMIRGHIGCVPHHIDEMVLSGLLGG